MINVSKKEYCLNNRYKIKLYVQNNKNNNIIIYKIQFIFPELLHITKWFFPSLKKTHKYLQFILKCRIMHHKFFSNNSVKLWAANNEYPEGKSAIIRQKINMIWSFEEMIQFLSKYSLHIYLANIQYNVPQTETRCSDRPSKRNTFHFISLLNIWMAFKC